MNTIDIVLYDGFDELDALGPFEVLQNGGFDTRLVALDAARPVTGSHGATVLATGVYGDRDADLVLVPGGGWNDRAERGAWGEAQRGELPRRLAERHAAGGALASVCTGATLLAVAGILDGRPATTHRSALETLREHGADVREERFVDDGDVLTSAGVTAGLDLALWIVERERGAQVAEAVARDMELGVHA